MRSILRKTLLSFFLSFFAFNTWAQGYQTNEDVVENGLQDIIVVGVSGIGGALIGLSTLSFEKNPGNHLSHILVGGAIGIIVGVGVVVWNQASKGGIWGDDKGYAFNRFDSLYARVREGYSGYQRAQLLENSIVLNRHSNLYRDPDAEKISFFVPAFVKSF